MGLESSPPTWMGTGTFSDSFHPSRYQESD